MIPKTIRIGGKNFPVKVVPDRDMDSARGRIYYEGQEIRLSDSQTADSSRETVLHEILHAASDLTGGRVEERDINGMSKCLFGILRDNRELVTWIMSEDDAA